MPIKDGPTPYTVSRLIGRKPGGEIIISFEVYQGFDMVMDIEQAKKLVNQLHAHIVALENKETGDAP